MPDLFPGAPVTSLRNSPPPTLVSGPLPTGTDVEVWCRSYDTWVTGFAIVDASPDGFRVKRHSDGSELPAVFALQDVRRSHKS